ncbi:hypothetical protein BKA63DRAFT_554766 [Paraphoma chrysanthemicola]|nr:hypothetical protein BKA63DRAFT_554766 [Paraphoma chrysanthemicola]
MSSNNSNPNSDNSRASPNTQPTFFHSATELADLGRARFDHDTALATDRDIALQIGGPVTVRQGRAPRGLEDQVFAWNTFKYTTEERDDREELKGELHDGQLHRQNRTVTEGMNGGGGEMGGPGFGGRGRGGKGGVMGGGGSRGGRGGGRGGRENQDGTMDALVAGRKPAGGAPPLAKNFAEELDKSMFWDGPIVSGRK